MTAQPRYHFRRDKDGCDDTMELYAIGQERPFACIRFWDEPDTDDATEAEALARRVVAALNACEGVSTEALERRRRVKRRSR